MADHVRERFLRYHQANPGVYDLFKQYAGQVRATGHQRFSADAILHRIRWHMTVETRGEFKVNNDAAAYYARLLIDEDPSFDGFFALRQADADRMRPPPPNTDLTDG